MALLKIAPALCLLTVLAAPLPAKAEAESCWTSVGGEQIGLFYDDNDTVRDNTTLRERMFGGRGEITCPAYVTLRHLTPDLTDEERAPFCLHYDKDARTYLGYAEGRRDAYLACKDPSKAFCSRVNASKGAALAITSLAAEKAEGAADVVGNITKHSSGAVILSGSGSSVASSLSSLGATAMSVATAPATLAAAAVSVVAVGGAVYVCSQ